MDPGIRMALFADNVGSIVMLVMVVISFIGWIVKLVNEKSQQNAPRPAARPQQAGDDRFEQEIDVFLQQVGGRRTRRPFEDEVAIEVVPESELLERRAAERRERKLSSIEDRHVQTSELGAGVRSQHLDEFETNIDDERISAVVEADFGDSVAKEAAPAVAAVRAAAIDPGDLVNMLRDPDGVKKAIIVNEILTRRSRG